MAISIPVLWSGNLPETLAFYQVLGYTVTYEMTRPYAYGVVERDGFQLHFGPTPKGVTAEEAYVGCLIMVDEVAAWHAEFKTALRGHYGRIPARGTPRITRFRPGQTRFTVVDPVGNSVIYIQQGEPDLEYGGSKELTGLAKVLDNARIFRDYKNDDGNAIRVIETGLRRFGDTAPAVDRERALAMLAELQSESQSASRSALDAADQPEDA
ncbi:hypothetical protein HDA40_002884 [Hamadaea flava]|uniref:Glyoxalase n=1 Tax=Hamadaea flava TaxID=1742688 RepID=A0ABV8LTT3_9ACTN|nr:glyoxalase [Hamadaea flava]MCP2324377.1 hypothetical protein [Hamadaea flava]